MNNKLKIYQLKKLKNYLKKKDLFFFFFLPNLTRTNQLKLEQTLFKHKLKIYTIKNSLLKYALTESVFLNFSNLVKGPLCIIEFNSDTKINTNFKNLLKFNSIHILSVKLNKKIYSNSQLKTISTLNYKSNIKILNKTFKRLLKIPYYKLNNSK